MTQGERVKELRKSLGLTLEKFGKTLGVGKTSISKIENNQVNLTEQMRKAICREYGASEEWLISGNGEMLTSLSRSEAISKFAGELIKIDDESFKKRLIEALAKLDEKEWDVLEDIAKKLAKKD